ncbi:hypothetical protein [Wenzhouxiangella sp. EGI_FJ10305]|uniref:hypothetical protein n=1 Tax=Wenzhouxiangella sp. EGI_FJ10305 TaxID=3243768 RepID=UPI0035DE1E37
MNAGSHKRLALALVLLGLVLAITKIIADSEPGAIPLALMIAGIGWLIYASRLKK